METTEAAETFVENKILHNSTAINDTNVDILEILGPKRDSLYVVITITVIYVIIFITGLVGNISTCVVIFRNKSMHTATNYYLFSLAISDLLLLVSGLPQEMYSIWSRYPYIFGQAFCVLRGLFSETSANATVLTITAFTVERYLAICHPFLSHTMSKLSRAVKFILIIWMVAIFFAVPQALQFDVVSVGNPETEVCQVARDIIPHSFEFSTFVFFVAPMTLITVLYALIGLRLRSSNRMKKASGDSIRSSNLINSGNKSGALKQRQGQSSRRVLKMLVAVVVAFFVCWAPFHTQRLVAIYTTGMVIDPEDHKRLFKIYEIVTYVSGILYYVSTTINPLLYNIMSNKFREAFRETFSRCCGLACVKAQRPECNYSILSRSLRRGPDSHTDSTGRDDPSVQTNVTLTHKNSQESMSFQSGAHRGSLKGRFDNLETNGGSCRTRQLNKITRLEEESSAIQGKYFGVQVQKEHCYRSVTFWNLFVCYTRKSSEPHVSGLLEKAQINIDLEKGSNKQNLSTSSCDISNSSLKDIDNAVLEHELANYLCMVTYQQ